MRIKIKNKIFKLIYKMIKIKTLIIMILKFGKIVKVKEIRKYN